MAAHSLPQGADWCERVFGVAPAPGGKHLTMGTHNRLLAIASAAFPQAYLEIIAIDPEGTPPSRPRWFRPDDAVLQARFASATVAASVARSDRLDATLAALAAQDLTRARPWRPSAPARRACTAGASPAAPTAGCCAAAHCRR